MASLLALQKTKQAMLPAKQTPILWGALAAVVVGSLILLSGWGRHSRWNGDRTDLDTLADNFYPPRRDALTAGFAIGTGVFGALWWAATTWSVVMNGMRRGSMGRGLLDFEIAALAGALTGGVVGAVLGLAIGHIWERRHRSRRRLHRPRHA
jgi:hypothetical protein